MDQGTQPLHQSLTSPAYTPPPTPPETGPSSLCLLCETRALRVPTSQGGVRCQSRGSAQDTAQAQGTRLALWVPSLLWQKLWFAARNMAQVWRHQDRHQHQGEEVWLDRAEFRGAGFHWGRPRWGLGVLRWSLEGFPATGLGTQHCWPSPTLPHLSTWPPSHQTSWSLVPGADRSSAPHTTL